MKPGFYKHINSMDVIFQLDMCHDYGFGQLFCVGMWWNMGYAGSPWEVEQAAINIKNENIEDWHYVGQKCPKRDIR